MKLREKNNFSNTIAFGTFPAIRWNSKKKKVEKRCVRCTKFMKGVRTMQGLGATIEREAKKEGRIEGRIEGKIEVLISMVKEGILKPDIAAHQLDMSEKDFLELMQNYDKGATNTSNVSVQSKIQND